MAELNIWSGGEEILPEIITDLGTHKFNSCKHRSAEEETRNIQTCCSSYKKTGYVCHRFDIFPVSPSKCEGCQEYSPEEGEKSIS